MSEEHDITLLLQQVNSGRDGAMDALMDRVYQDLKRIAASRLKGQFGADAGAVTLEPTALVNETYLKLIKQRQAFDNRGHFFAIATRMMLRVLMDHHRARGAAKRGGNEQVQVTLSGLASDEAAQMTAVPRLIELFEKLEERDARASQIAKLRLLWGLGPLEVAETLNLSESTVHRDWRFARAWLRTELGAD